MQPAPITCFARLIVPSLLAAALPAWAQTEPPLPTLQECAAIGAAADRLACYDRLAGRALPTPAPGDTPASTTQLAPAFAPAAAANGSEPDASLLSKYWELDARDKRGTFNLLGYRANYIAPLHATNRINRAPSSPTQVVVNQPNYRRVEAKFQISLRTKVLQDVFDTGGDVWLAFTQQAMWQIWNGRDSKPFRNTDYEPEASFVLPTKPGLRRLPWGWQWRFTQLAIAHQSNGQSDPLSRSWNRIYAGVGIERGDLTLIGRVSQRIGERYSSDNNPDLVDYRGRGEVQLGWTPGASTTSVLYRTAVQGPKYGALQLEWTYPMKRAQPNGLRWFVQAFSGYGETLTDYNFRQSSFALGLMFMQF
ncbi:MAG: phospholipase A [Rhizobacter sp.]|nr:phospholipase A [Rhizobacter sp.]